MSPVKIFLLRITLFFGAFLLAAVIVFQASSFFSGPIHSSPVIEQATHDEADEESERRFPKTFRVRTGGDFISLNHSPDLEPARGEDFGLFVWIRPRGLLKEGDNSIFVAKLKAHLEFVSGYSFGIIRRGEVDRPALFWGDIRGQGGKFLFSDIVVPPKEWMLLTLGVFQGQRVVVHSVTTTPEGGTSRVFHGSHILEQPVYPTADKEPLIVGALKSGLYRGELGPFGILIGENFEKNWNQIRTVIEDNALSQSEIVSKNEVMLFVPDGQGDLSAFQHEVKASKVDRKNRKGK